MMYRAKMVNLTLFSLILLLLIGCDGGNMSQGTVSFDSVNKIPDAVWQKLSEKGIFFGHQSVGYNIIDGIEDIQRNDPRIKLNIVKVKNPSELRGAMFAHSNMGENGDPPSKIKAFGDFIEQGMKYHADIAFFKFCYVDINSQSDVERIFMEYKKTMEHLTKKHPRTRFVHTTVPLTESKKTVKNFVKTVLGRADNNINRNKFNEMLWKEYGGKEPIFDIAKAESTYPDGTRTFFKHTGVIFYSLAPEYTTDGGHLNELGKRAVAKELLLLLANIVTE